MAVGKKLKKIVRIDKKHRLQIVSGALLIIGLIIVFSLCQTLLVL